MVDDQHVFFSTDFVKAIPCHALVSADKAKTELTPLAALGRKCIQPSLERLEFVQNIICSFLSLSSTFADVHVFQVQFLKRAAPPMSTHTYILFVWVAFEKSGGEDRGLPWCSSPKGPEETSINSGSNVRAKITHLLINGTYTQNKREMKHVFL